MPKIEQTVANVNIRSHTFKFISPSATDTMKIPNACNTCHSGETTKWALDAMKGWTNVSAWRIQ
jgi:hypothetical protein